jgi:hypothetical protein
VSNNVPALSWYSIAMSADGTRLLAAAYGVGLYSSVDSGVTWVSNSVPVSSWFSVATSADGNHWVAVAGSGQGRGPIYTSSNLGSSWVSNNVPADYWLGVACSADGSKLVAIAVNDYYTSSDFGGTWISNGLPSVVWQGVASSADGNKLLVSTIVGGTHRLFTSTDSGASWITNNAPIGRVAPVASSADGIRLAAVELGLVWTSTDSGASWLSSNLPNSWHGVALSADGGQMAVVDANHGGVWLSQMPVNPLLSLAPVGNNVAISWVIPSTNFLLQQTPALDSAGWTTVSNSPVFNPSALQNQVIIAPSSDRSLYRLVH